MKLLLTLFTFLTVSFSLSAQTDPLAEALKDVYTPSNRPQVSASPDMKAKLDEAIKVMSSQQGSSSVMGITGTLSYSPEQLCGTSEPKPVTPEAIQAQEDMNKKTILRAEAELKKQRVAVPNVPNGGGGVSAGGPSVSAASYYRSSAAVLGPIRDQGGCGSCWAFAAASAYETAFRKFYGTARTVDMSEQDLLDCGRTYGLFGWFGQDAGSCAGGQSNRAFDYIKSYGTTTESNNRYVGRDQGCVERPKRFYAWAWGSVSSDINTMKNYIAYYGSIVTYIKALNPYDNNSRNSPFMNYRGNIVTWPASSGNYGIDHAVTIVGWDDRYNAWIIRNSWNTGWGYGGYAYINYNACNVGKYNYYIYPYYSGGGVSGSADMPTVAGPPAAEGSPLLKD
jgi:cathepsin L